MTTEFDRLADIVQRADLVRAVMTLGGGFAEFFERETAAYREAAGDAASDEGLAQHMRQRSEEIRKLWAADVATLTGLKPL
jgi:arsenate reductase-like glutaredoxin family protein